MNVTYTSRSVNGLDQVDETIKCSYYVISFLSDIIRKHDSGTLTHSRNVSIYSMQIAEAMGYNDREIGNIATVAMVHDIGKVGIPEKIDAHASAYLTALIKSNKMPGRFVKGVLHKAAPVIHALNVAEKLIGPDLV